VGENIQKAIYDLISQKKPPTLTNISAATGYHRHTIQRHADTLNFKTTSKNYAILSEKVLINLLYLSHKHPAACKLWFQVVEGWVEKQQLTNEDNEPFKLIFQGFNPCLIKDATTTTE
jgi:hypothetical protein